MKEPRHKALAVILAAALASPCAAAPSLTSDILVSSAPVSKREPPLFRFNFQQGTGPQGRSSVGIGVGLSEGKPLEMMLWGGSGAVVGSLAGPLGTIAGAATGAVVGLLISIFIVPHNGPQPPSPVSD